MAESTFTHVVLRWCEGPTPAQAPAPNEIRNPLTVAPVAPDCSWTEVGSVTGFYARLGKRAFDSHVVKPGITGSWQVSKQALGLAYQGVDLDIDYLRRVSLRTDCAILWQTVPTTRRRTGR